MLLSAFGGKLVSNEIAVVGYV